MQETMPIVTVILSISTAVLPIMFGYIVFRMSQIFVTKAEFQAYQTTQDREYLAIVRRLDEVNANTLELLQRTAHLRNGQTT